jgi:mono/diheme cytochrome c family protein
VKKPSIQNLTPRVAAVSAAVLLGVILSWYVMIGVSRGSSESSHELLQRGARVFEAQCAQCHGSQADWPIDARLKGRSRDDLYALLDHLPAANPVMPGFHGTDDERRALAAYLFSRSPSQLVEP